MNRDELVGHAARAMVAQDARWIADSVLSTQDSEASGWIPLLMLGHSSRIVYEGSIAAKSSTPHVGVPALAARLSHEHSQTIARSRHAGKFLDDTKRPLPDLKTEMLKFYAAHQREFLGNAVFFARWLETDIGVCLGPDNHVLTSTITGHFRLGFESEIRISESRQDSFELATTQGSVLAILAALAGDSTTPTSTMSYRSHGPITDKDWRADRYLKSRYDPDLDIGTKLILLMIEGELNSVALILAPGAAEHREAAFRARVVSLFHSLRGIDEILNANPTANSSATENIRTLLAEPAMRRWLDEKPLRLVRNRCMHYEMRGPTYSLDPAAPMFGIVEGLSPIDTFDSLNAETTEVIERLRDAVHTWNT